MKRMSVLAAGLALSSTLAAGAADARVGMDGTVRFALGGGVEARGLVNFDDWRSSAAPVFSTEGRADARIYELRSRGAVYAKGTWTWGTGADGAVTLTNALVFARGVKAQAAGTRLYLPHSAFAGGTWTTDAGASGVFPTNTMRAGLFTGRAVRGVTLRTTAGETVSFAFPAPRFVHLSNDAAWCDAFSLRLQPPGEFKPGDRIEDVFSVSAPGRALAAEAAEPVALKAGAEWIPLAMRKGVVPGGATDFSDGRAPRRPAGADGWLRRVGGHFEFEKRPGVPARFYGVNLVGSCCWPKTKMQAEELAERIVRSGYNSVRFHHVECAGGVTTGTGDPTGTALNPETMDRLDDFAARLIARGVYLTIDLYSYRTAPWKALGHDRPGSPTFMQMKGMIHLSDAGLENWKAYAANLMNHVNPYTGRAYKDEPAMPLVCLVNEAALTQGWDAIRELPEASAALGRDARLERTQGNPAFTAFTMDVERRSLSRMIPFLRELGVKALLTDMNNGPHTAEKQAVRAEFLDYFDNHFYVDHPRWLGERLRLPFAIRNKDLFDYPDRSFPVDYAAAVRIPEMPYTITEWNFCAPSSHRHQGGLYTAAVAARERWDGLWCFTYAHGINNLFEDTAKGGVGSFDVMTDPVNQANERALVALYLRGDAFGRDALKTDRASKSFTVDTPRTQGGAARAGRALETSGLSARLAGADAAVWASSMDAAPSIAESRRVLVTHLVDVQNTDARWADEARTIVLDRGRRPLLAHAGTAAISLAVAPGPWTVWALETDGRRRARVPAKYESGRLVFTADVARDTKNATLLYECER